MSPCSTVIEALFKSRYSSRTMALFRAAPSANWVALFREGILRLWAKLTGTRRPILAPSTGTQRLSQSYPTSCATLCISASGAALSSETDPGRVAGLYVSAEGCNALNIMCDSPLSVVRDHYMLPFALTFRRYCKYYLALRFPSAVLCRFSHYDESLLNEKLTGRIISP